ncbi:MAG: DEAD/DEAH box helicase, partial [Planctomycetes bacterium]|nr:DEAD/DEAH box helicase [Planctomycetota bacterium]
EAAAATLGAQSPARIDDDTSSEEDGDEAEEGDSNPREGPDTGPLDQAVLQLLASSVRQELGGNVYESPLLCFTAAAGIRKTPLGYAEPHLYTGLLAGVLWWSRAVFLEVCFASQPRELEEVDFDALEAFDKEHARWMCAGTHTVIGEVIRLMAYGKGCRRNMARQASIRWEQGHGALVHSGDRIAVDDVKRTARGLVTDAELLLDQLLSRAWEKERGRIDLRRIRDDMARRGAGDSFATRPENEWLGSGPDKVVRLAGSLLWDAQQSRYKLAFIRKWMKRLRRFREQLIVAVHVWGGQPGRGPELATLRHADSLMLLRNVFVLDGMVAIVTDRDKMKSIRGQGRKVARFIPERLGKIVVAYVAWLLPAEEALAELCGGPRPRADELEFMWRHGDSRAWDSARASTLLARTTHAGIGVRLGLMRYRVVAIELGRQIRGLAVRQLETSIGEDGDDDDAVELDPVTGEPVDCGGSWDVVWDLQATHGTRVAQQHYAVHLGFPGQLTEQMIETYRQISRLWHQFLEHDPAPGRAGRGARASWEAGERKRIRAGADDEGLETDIVAGLRRLLGAGATWRSDEQAVAAQTILGPRGRDESVIVVLPTGGGKSLLFMLPAVMRDTGTSIVVVPFVALADDLVDRAQLAGVDCIQFRSSSSSGREGMQRVARLVVVGAETATGAEFAAYADALAGAGQLGQVFVDECHTIITDQGYRAKLGELRRLHRFGRPLVMLTATLPVPLEDWFRQEMLATSAIIVRGRTTKANCGYRVLRARPGRAVDFTVKEMQRIGRDFTGSDKGVVYCRSRDECEAVAEAGGYAAHHSGMTEEERTGAREAWAGGAGPRWIAATTGLGTGIDIQGVVAVLHLGAPYGLVDFAQQTGRGGRRDGESVYSAIVDEGGRGRGEARTRGFVEEVNTGRMAEFMRTPGCRRAVLSSFMDGVEGETCGDVKGGAVPCDRCVAASAAAQGQGDQGRQGRWAASEGRRARQGEAVRQWLDEVDGCAMCDVMRRRGEAGQDHEEGSAAQCTPVQWQEVRRLGGGRIEALCGCYQCRLPLD